VIEGLYRSAAEGRAIDLGAAPESGAGARA
jgi:hypothetical protein